MSALITTTKRYRLYVIIADYKHYANRSDPLKWPRVSWQPRTVELFPDHFTYDEMYEIRDMYSDQKVYSEGVWVNDEDE